MSKENISATVDQPVSRFVQQDHINTSGLVNRLLKNYINGNESDLKMLELREEQLQGDIQDLRNSLETKESQLQDVQDRIESIKSAQQSELKEVFQRMETMKPLEPDNPGLVNEADRVGMEPTELIEAFEKRDTKTNANTNNT